MPKDFTVLAPIIPGHEETLRAALLEIGNDVQGRRLEDNPEHLHIHFTRSQFTHFARFVIIANPDAGENRKRLLFSTNFDGDLDTYLAEFARITTDIEAIWSHCEGFVEADSFVHYLKAHSYKAQAYYIAFRDESVASIHHNVKVLADLEEQLDDQAQATAWLKAHQSKGQLAILVAELRHFWQSTQKFFNILFRKYIPLIGAIIQMGRKYGVRNVWRSSKRITATLNRIRIFRIFNTITHNVEPPQPSPYSAVEINNCNPCVALAEGDEVTAGADGHPPEFIEDVILQNQLTMIVVIQPKYLQRLYTVLALIDTYARYLAPPGSLAGMSTIHFVRWVVIDNGKRMMMLSNYDGTWEAYIGEFAEMILSGLNAIWENFIGWQEAGAGDVDAFKRFLRCHQEQAQIFYSAYPYESVLNIKQTRDIYSALNNTADPDELKNLLNQL